MAIGSSDERLLASHPGLKIDSAHGSQAIRADHGPAGPDGQVPACDLFHTACFHTDRFFVSCRVRLGSSCPPSCASFWLCTVLVPW